MSRCFPYPPPGYALSGAKKDALIESIKLQKQKVKAEEQRKKEKKRDKKEKRKEKKEKKDKRSQKQGNSDIVHSHFGGKLWTDAKPDFPLKGGKTAESEPLEWSSLTEEHAKPVCLRGPSSSSDSTENSNKRKREPSPVDVRRGHGKIIRIRLSSKKQNQSDAPPANDQKQCSMSGRLQAPPQIENDISVRQRSEGFCSTSGSTINVGQSLVLKTGGERIHVASKQIKTAPSLEAKALPAASKQIKTAPPPLQTKALPAANAVMTAMQEEGLLYQNLLENWVPPQLHDECVDNGDEDWLFGGKNKLELSEKRRVCRDDIIPCSNTSSLWPRAEYLPEVDLFALPFTVPF